ncbi:insulin gene enhancer protein ISL-1-like [Centroberyx gerrardi]|uniref:insulin gene enhancer protein ISL-1-like n=1 Tax=Centroberyx gerrardi TaxID=166262 RepID=UPI003AAF48FA
MEQGCGEGIILDVSPPERRRRDRGRWRVQRRGAVRVRTVLSESQLRVLLACYSQTPRPDAAAKHRLGQLTGLSPRVIRVWFQNKRCKDKKRRATGRDEETYSACEPAGPMVVVSPDPPDFALQICVYESPWQPLSSHKDLPLIEMSPSTWSSADLDSPQQHSHDDTITLLTI